MTILVNLYGGPGTGKSTSAAYAFAKAKSAGLNAELVTEYVKQWAWENRKPVNYDQFYFFGKQARKEYTLFGKVDLIITDSPVGLSGYYTEVFGSSSQAACLRAMVKEYYSMVEKSGIECIHIFLERVKAYNPKGRFQTEEEARQMDIDQKLYFSEFGFNMLSVKADENAADEILKIVETVRGAK